MGEIRKYGKHKYWTEKEEKQLKILSKTKTSYQIAKIMGRTRSSIDSKRDRLGIDDCMTTTDKIIAKQIGALVGQHEKSIYQRWRKAGLPLKPFANHYYAISEKELVNFMKQHNELWRASQCDYDFFCRYDWFLERLKKERDGTDIISHHRKWKEWTEYEKSRAKMLYQKGMMQKDIAKELGRSPGAIYKLTYKYRKELKNADKG